MKKIFLFFLFSYPIFLRADSWLQRTSLPSAFGQYTAAFVVNGKGYIATGCNYQNTYPLPYLWEFDPLANSWTQKADFGGGNRKYAVGFAIGNLGYVGTGSDNIAFFKDFWSYDPLTNLWTQKNDFAGFAREYAVGFSIGNKGYIGTGLDSGYTNDFWEYDPVLDSWQQKSSIGTVGRVLATGFSILNKGYIGCGAYHMQDFWEYDPVANSWTQKADFGGGIRTTAIGFSIGSYGYMGEGDGVRDFWMYDPGSNTWLAKTPNPFILGGRSNGNGFCIGNKGYFGLGGVGTFDFPDFWEYTPDSITSVKELAFLSFTITPNPAKQFVYLIIANAIADAQVSLYSISGEMVYSTNFSVCSQKTKINLPWLCDGIYFLKISLLNSSFSQKLVIRN
jgi:N-acetylneuraminic acid mutarotase